MKNSFPILCFIGWISLASCGSNSNKDGGFFSSVSDAFENNISAELIKTQYQQFVNSSDSSSKLINNQLDTLYSKNEFKPLWIKGNAFNDNAKGLVKAIGDLKFDGLNPENYHLSTLIKYLETKKPSDDSLAKWDIVFSSAFLKAANDLTFGVLKPSAIDNEWHASNDSTISFNKMFEFDDKSKDILSAYRPQNERYQIFRNEMKKWNQLMTDSTYLNNKSKINDGIQNVAQVQEIIKKEIKSNDIDSNLIKSYQYLNHLSSTGKIDEETIKILKKQPENYITQLKINMERMRWLPNNMESQYIWVSIPQAEVDYYKDHKNQFHNRTIVGSKVNRTPSILQPLTNIVICPPWGVPMSIVGKEYGGRIPSKYQVFKGGKQVPNSMVNASNFRQFAVRQPPGPAAALGYVKFNLPNKWDIYLHDTPNRSLFGNKVRYMSHGCVRVKEPKVLAALLLEHQGVGVDSINTIIKKNRTTPINTDKIPVYISYLTTNVDSSMTNVLYLNDPYKKDSILVKKVTNL